MRRKNQTEERSNELGDSVAVLGGLARSSFFAVMLGRALVIGLERSLSLRPCWNVAANSCSGNDK